MPGIKNRYSDNIIRPLKSENHYMRSYDHCVWPDQTIHQWGQDCSGSERCEYTCVYRGIVTVAGQHPEKVYSKGNEEISRICCLSYDFFWQYGFVKYEYCDGGSAFFRHLLPLL